MMFVMQYMVSFCLKAVLEVNSLSFFFSSVRDRYRVPLPCLETESENTQVLKIVLSVLVPGFWLLNQVFLPLNQWKPGMLWMALRQWLLQGWRVEKWYQSHEGNMMWGCEHPFIHLFNRCLLATFSVPGSVLGAGNTIVTIKVLVPLKFIV